MSEQLIYLSAAVGCAGIAAVTDLKEKRIPNRLTGPAILAGLLLHLMLGGVGQFGWALLAGLIGGGIFLLFYLAGGMGAGDVKLMTAVGCIAGISAIKEVLLATVIVGAIFAVVLAACRGRFREMFRNVFTLMAHHRQHGLTEHAVLNVQNRAGLRLPYAVPIALGCVFALCMNASWSAGL